MLVSVAMSGLGAVGGWVCVYVCGGGVGGGEGTATSRGYTQRSEQSSLKCSKQKHKKDSCHRHAQ